MAKIMTNEVKTGFLVIVSLAILIVLTVSVGKFAIFQEQYKVKLIFNWVSGIGNDAPVRLSGVEVGKVESVQLAYKGDETKVLLTLLLDSGAKLREDSKAYVTALGLMGEKYIEMTAGSKGQAFLKPDSTIVGEDPMRMEDMMDIGKRIADEVETTLGNIRKLTNHLDEMVVDNRTNIDGIVGNLERTTANFEEFSDDIKRNPWKLMSKAKEEPKKSQKKRR